MSPRHDSPLPHFRQRQVRDLAWACFAEPLIDVALLPDHDPAVSNSPFILTPERLAWLEELDRDPAPLLQHLDPLPGRLGLYFEKLWHFFLSREPAVDLVQHNLPVRDGPRTIGEFDCLYFCHQRQRHVHLELAVKYYLGYTGQDIDAARWLGPNSADRLDLKLAHLLQRQIRLSQTGAGEAVLAELGIDQPLLEIDLRGYLFSPADQPLPPPPGLSPGRHCHPWLRLEALAAFLATRPGHCRYRVLPRLEWLAPAQLEDGPTMTTSELRRELGDCRRPALVAEFDDQGWERDRFFVTGAQWPGVDNQG